MRLMKQSQDGSAIASSKLGICMSERGRIPVIIGDYQNGEACISTYR